MVVYFYHLSFYKILLVKIVVLNLILSKIQKYIYEYSPTNIHTPVHNGGENTALFLVRLVRFLSRLTYSIILNTCCYYYCLVPSGNPYHLFNIIMTHCHYHYPLFLGWYSQLFRCHFCYQMGILQYYQNDLYLFKDNFSFTPN